MSWGHSRGPGPSGSGPSHSFLASTVNVPVRPASSDAARKYWIQTAAALDQWVRVLDPASGAGSLLEQVQSHPELRAGQLLERLPEPYVRALKEKLGGRGFVELACILQEKDPQIFLHQMQSFGQRLSENDHLEAAGWIFQRTMELAKGDSRFSSIATGAEREFNAMVGVGATGPRIAFLARRFSEEATDPWMLAGFGVAGAAFKTSKLFALAKILENPTARFYLGESGAGLLASGAALSVEAPVFTLTVKGGRELFGTSQNWNPDALIAEIEATGLTLLFLKGMGAASETAFNKLHGIDPLRPQALRLPALVRFSQTALPQAGMYLGILLAHGAETRWGLRPAVEGGTVFTDSLATLLQFNIGGNLADRALGKGFKIWQQKLDFQARSLTEGGGTGKVFEGIGGSEVFAGASGLELRGEELRDFLNKPSNMMSEGKDGKGGGDGDGKVIPLFPEKADPAGSSGAKAPTSEMFQLTPIQIADLAPKPAADRGDAETPPQEREGMVYFLKDPIQEAPVVDRPSEPIDVLFNPNVWDQHIADFIAAWVKQAGGRVSSAQREGLEKALDTLPSYFIQKLSTLSFENPLLAKVILVKLGMVSSDSELAREPSVLHELSQKSGEQIPAEEFEELAGKIIYYLRHYAPMYFPEQYRPALVVDAKLKEHLGELPPVVLRGLAHPELRPAQFLLIMNKLDLSEFGYPPFESLPE